MREQERRRRTPRCGGCCALALGLPAITLLALFFTFRMANRPPGLQLPAPVMPAVNAYDDFVKAGQLAKNRPHLFPVSMPNVPPTYSLADYAKADRDAAPALAVLRRGLGKPCQAPAVRSSANVAFPAFATFRELARTLSGQAEYYALTGRPARAADSLLDGQELGAMVPRGGTLIAALVGNAIQAIGTAPFEPLLPELTASELAHVAARLDRIAAKHVPPADILLEEGYSSTAIWQEAFRSPEMNRLSLDYFDILRSMTGTVGTRVTPAEVWSMARFSLANKQAMLEENLDYCKALAEEMRTKHYTGKSSVKPPDNLIMDTMGGLLETIRPRLLTQRALTDLLRVETALYRYRAAHGRFPQTLELLTPSYLKTLPNDPFDGGKGRSFLYRPTSSGTGFLLYSPGPDLKDDGGKRLRYPSTQGSGDLVAGQLWPPRRLPRRPAR